MDLYDEGFKIQDLMDSEIRSLRSEIDDYLSELPRTPGSPLLSSLPPMLPMDIVECSVNSNHSDDDGIGWMNSSHIYNVSSDLDSVGGLLVNPETALPVMQSPTLTGTVSITLTSNTNGALSDGEDGITMPVQVITTALVSDSDSKHAVNLTLAVPTTTAASAVSSNASPTKMAQVQKFLSFHKFSNGEDCDTSRLKSRQQKQSAAKISQQVTSANNAYPKPAYSYSCLIAMALKNSRTGSLPVNEIYDFMTENFPYFKTAPNGWKNSVRHNLSLNKCFEKIEKPTGNSAQRKGYLWALNPAKVEKMEEELQKWGSRDPDAIRKSMANPEKLELIEKGELKHGDHDDVKVPISVPSAPQITIKEEVHSPNSMEVNNSSVDDCLNTDDMSANDFSPLDAPVGMDSNLPELDLQKGIWENLCDDRLQFISGGPLINSSSPKHSPNLDLEEGNSLPSAVHSMSSDLPKSFIHANYIYSCSSSLEHSDPLKQHSNVSMSEKTTTCDA